MGSLAVLVDMGDTADANLISKLLLKNPNLLIEVLSKVITEHHVLHIMFKCVHVHFLQLLSTRRALFPLLHCIVRLGSPLNFRLGSVPLLICERWGD